MDGPLWIVFGSAAAALGALLIWRVGRAYWLYRGARVITCPETQAPAAVVVDAAHAGRTAIAGAPELQLADCSRWPERRACGQECLAQIERAPENCLVRTIVAGWYEGKNCRICGHRLEPVGWTHHPALLGPEGVTVAWPDVAAETLPQVLQTHFPVCWNCHVVETFRRRFPDKVVETPRWDRDRPGRPM